jgi:hypothetical protein
MEHWLFLAFFFGAGHITDRIASSNTFFNPFCVKAEDSRYLWALISFALAIPCSNVTGANPFSLNRSLVSRSSLKSSLVPTRIIGLFGQWWLISGYHFEVTFSKEEGEMIEKQSKKTSV